jgi:uncharacterized protein (DUF934 family)
MQKLIKDGAIIDNSWQLIEKTAEPDCVIPAGQVLLPLLLWQARRAELAPRQAEIGVWLDSDQTADLLGEAAAGLPLVAINFPTFMDGRGFTAARLLRERYGFSGELRAMGVMRDQLFYLQRCGFNAFQLNRAETLEGAIASLQDFSETYPAAVDQPLPLYRRRV